MVLQNQAKNNFPPEKICFGLLHVFHQFSHQLPEYFKNLIELSSLKTISEHIFCLKNSKLNLNLTHAGTFLHWD